MITLHFTHSIQNTKQFLTPLPPNPYPHTELAPHTALTLPAHSSDNFSHTLWHFTLYAGSLSPYLPIIPASYKELFVEHVHWVTMHVMACSLVILAQNPPLERYWEQLTDLTLCSHGYAQFSVTFCFRKGHRFSTVSARFSRKGWLFTVAIDDVTIAHTGPLLVSHCNFSVKSVVREVVYQFCRGVVMVTVTLLSW